VTSGSRKTVNPDGRRTITVIANGKTLVFNERGRYADVAIVPGKLSAPDAAALDSLFATYGITDVRVKGKVYEAIENARLTDKKAVDIQTAIKRHAEPLLEHARKEGAKAAKPISAEQIIAGTAKDVPLMGDTDPKILAAAQRHIAEGILNDEAFKSNRQVEELRDLVTEGPMRETAKERAAHHGAKGGQVLSRIRFFGDIYVDGTTTTPKRTNVDVAPDIDVAYVVDVGGKFEIQYIGGGKVVNESQERNAARGARSQNKKGEAAVVAGAARFKRDDGQWAEIRTVSGKTETGASIPLTNKLVMSPSAKSETIGAPSGNNVFDAEMKSADIATLDKIVQTIWRIAELKKR
jgi:hypothetical protein